MLRRALQLVDGLQSSSAAHMSHSSGQSSSLQQATLLQAVCCSRAAVFPCCGRSAAFSSAAGDLTALQPEQQHRQTQQQPATQQERKQGIIPPKYSLETLANGLSSRIRSRKPAIKHPARHQWHVCLPGYDPMQPVPEQPLPPYAPAARHQKNYREIFLQEMPKHHRNRYRRMWAKNMAMADQRWRQRWEKHLAAGRKSQAKQQRLTDTIVRQRSWEAWKAEQQLQQQQQLSIASSFTSQ